MALSVYARTCGKNIPGNLDTVYLCEEAELASVTITADEVSAVTMELTKTFKAIQADVDGVQFSLEGNGKTNYRETQSLLMRFSKKSKTLIALKDSLIDGISCGLIVIRVDSNGKAYLSGYSVAEGTGRPYNEIETSFDSGRELSEDDAQIYTITLKRMSGYDEIPFDTTQNTAIVGGTATYITFS